MAALVSCDHSSFNDDNAKVCYYLEKASMSAQCAASIKLYQINKNRRDVYLSLDRQYTKKNE